MAEAAQKQVRGMEMDYEEVIHLLEAEIAELKTQRAEQPAQAKVPCLAERMDRGYLENMPDNTITLSHFFK